jgi:hypothetical protein
VRSEKRRRQSEVVIEKREERETKEGKQRKGLERDEDVIGI